MNNKTIIQKINEHYVNKLVDGFAGTKINTEDLDALFKEWKSKLDNLNP
jgi:hypothetical protein